MIGAAKTIHDYLADLASKHSASECWPTSDYRHRYKVIKFNGKMVPAHRASWMVANQREIPEGMLVMHSCDHPCCINPSHLSLGTHRENSADCIARNRRGMRKSELLADGDKRAERITFLATEQDAASLKAAAEREGRSLSNYILNAALKAAQTESKETK